MADDRQLKEFDLIARLQRRLSANLPSSVLLGIGDDAALIEPPSCEQLLITMDTLHAGVHFPNDTLASDLGWKALAVNLSDLAAMGAEPRWCTLSLTLEKSDASWIEEFIDGLMDLAQIYPIALIGGDTTAGPLSMSLTAIGGVPPGAAMQRDGAQVDDDIWLTGCTGDAAAALWLWRQGRLHLQRTAHESALEQMRQRLIRPMPRIHEGIAVRSMATAAIDLSDGLVADLSHICRRSQVGGEIELCLLPPCQAQALDVSAEQIALWQLSGGDDYELCFTAPQSCRPSIENALLQSEARVTRIGRIVAEKGVRVRTFSGALFPLPHTGYQHFSSDACRSKDDGLLFSASIHPL